MSDSDGLLAHYFYNDMGQLYREYNYTAQKMYEYRYFDGENLKYKVQCDINGQFETIISYGYDSQWKDLLTSHAGQAITYDNAGNPLSYKGNTLTWQNGRQMASYANANVSAAYQYDYAGIRTQKSVNGVTTNYIVEGSRILAERSSNLPHANWYFYDESGIYGFQNQGTNYIFEKNIFGDITKTFNMHTTHGVTL